MENNTVLAQNERKVKSCYINNVTKNTHIYMHINDT